MTYNIRRERPIAENTTGACPPQSINQIISNQINQDDETRKSVTRLWLSAIVRGKVIRTKNTRSGSADRFQTRYDMRSVLSTVQSDQIRSY